MSTSVDTTTSTIAAAPDASSAPATVAVIDDGTVINSNSDSDDDSGSSSQVLTGVLTPPPSSSPTKGSSTFADVPTMVKSVCTTPVVPSQSTLFTPSSSTSSTSSASFYPAATNGNVPQQSGNADTMAMMMRMMQTMKEMVVENQKSNQQMMQAFASNIDARLRLIQTPAPQAPVFVSPVPSYQAPVYQTPQVVPQNTSVFTTSVPKFTKASTPTSTPTSAPSTTSTTSKAVPKAKYPDRATLSRASESGQPTFLRESHSHASEDKKYVSSAPKHKRERKIKDEDFTDLCMPTEYETFESAGCKYVSSRTGKPCGKQVKNTSCYCNSHLEEIAKRTCLLCKRCKKNHVTLCEGGYRLDVYCGSCKQSGQGYRLTSIQAHHIKEWAKQFEGDSLKQYIDQCRNQGPLWVALVYLRTGQHHTGMVPLMQESMEDFLKYDVHQY